MPSDNLQVSDLNASDAEKTNKINNMVQQLEDGLTETVALAMTDANRVITDAEFNRNVHFDTGGATLTANRTISLPDTRRRFLIVDNTTAGGFAVVVSATTPSTTATVDNATRALLYYDGTDVVLVGSSATVGAVTGLTADTGGTTTGAVVTIAGGANVSTARSGDVVTIDSTAAGGGGAGSSGTRYDPLVAPDAADASGLDDEFVATVAAKWTTFDPGTVAPTIETGNQAALLADKMLQITVGSAQADFVGIHQTYSNGDGDIALITKLSLNPATETTGAKEGYWGIAFVEATGSAATTNFLLCGIKFERPLTGVDDAVVFEVGIWEFDQFDDATETKIGGSQVFTDHGGYGGALFFRTRFADTPNTISLDVSRDGISWNTVTTLDLDLDTTMTTFNGVGLFAARRTGDQDPFRADFFRTDSTASALDRGNPVPAGTLGAAAAGNSRYDVLTAPSTADASGLTDEFDAATLDTTTKWTIFDQGAAVPTFETATEGGLAYEKGLNLSLTAEQVDIVGIYQARVLADGDISFTAEVGFGDVVTNDTAGAADHFWGIGFIENSAALGTSDLLIAGLRLEKGAGAGDAVQFQVGVWEFGQFDDATPTVVATQVQTFTDHGGYGGGILIRTRIDQSASTIFFDVSRDGIYWNEVANVVLGTDTTMTDFDEIGLFGSRRDNQATFRAGFFRADSTAADILDASTPTPAGSIGGGGGLTDFVEKFDIDSPPASDPLSANDEFLASGGSTLSALWTQWDEGGSSTFNERAEGFLDIQAGNTTDWVGIHQEAPPDGDEWTIYTKFGVTMRGTADADEVRILLFLAEDLVANPSTANFSGISLLINAPASGPPDAIIESINYLGSTGSATAAGLAPQTNLGEDPITWIYFRIRNEGSLTTFRGETSFDGINWIENVAAINHSTLTPDRIGVGVKKDGGSATVLRVQFFRVVDSSSRNQVPPGRRVKMAF